MDIIFLHDLKVNCIIGVFEWERRAPRRLRIDLDLGFDIQAAAKSDDLNDTLNYADIADKVTQLCETSEFALLEPLAQHIADLLLTQFAVSWCRIRINKFGAVKNAGDVGVIIERST